MALMKETPRSLRAYFFLLGIIATLGFLGGLAVLEKVTGASGMLNVVWLVLPLAVVAWEFLYVGIRFSHLLQVNPKRLNQAVYTALGMDVLQIVMDIHAGAAPASAATKGGMGALICLYILANIRRLADEAVAPPAPPA